MSRIDFTRHCECRMAQRGVSQTDVRLIIEHGTEVRGGYILTDKDVRRVQERLQKQLKELDRNRGKLVIVDDGRAITTYRARKGKIRDLLRRCEERSLATA